MKIYTKTGDKGKTSLLNGHRIPKSSSRVETYGTVDELNSVIGLVLAHLSNERIIQDIDKISNLLFNLGSDLATPIDVLSKYQPKRICQDDIKFIEKMIDDYTVQLPELKAFILPGGSKPAGYLHLARTVCRRAERLAVALAENEDIGEFAIIFLNRLSDYFFTASRLVNHFLNIKEREWEK